VNRKGFSALRWASISLIVLAFILLVLQLVTYSRIRNNFPTGTLIANIPVGGLDQTQAAERLVMVYSSPIEVHYADSVILIRPSSVGFQMDLDSMISATDQQRVSQPFWIGFWNYLWNRLPNAINTPLSSTISEDRMRQFLKDEIASRYDQPAIASEPVPGSTSFRLGQTGSTLDIDRAVILLSDALQSATKRVANLSLNQSAAPRPSMQNLQVLIQQIIDQQNFTGLTEVYVKDLQNGQELSFAYSNKKNYPPNIGFTAASTMKIPIMISTFRKEPEPTPQNISALMVKMIEASDNVASDQLLQTALDQNLGPLMLTDDMKALGLQNTFMAGYFYNGAPLLNRFTTPGNSRTDVNTDPDTYNQTTPVEMGMLLNDIYDCAQGNGGTFAIVFPGQISQAECASMITYLDHNRIGVLLEAGVPDGTQIAHKHGWTVNPYDGLIHTIGDAGLIFTPGGKYIIVVFMYHPTQLVWDDANRLTAYISTAVYNYYNLPTK
jgi:beta-lactamase class A